MDPQQCSSCGNGKVRWNMKWADFAGRQVWALDTTWLPSSCDLLLQIKVCTSLSPFVKWVLRYCHVLLLFASRHFSGDIALSHSSSWRGSQFLHFNSEMSTWPTSGSSQPRVGWGQYPMEPAFPLHACHAFLLPKGWTVTLGLTCDVFWANRKWQSGEILTPAKSFVHQPATLVPLPSLWEQALAGLRGGKACRTELNHRSCLSW